MSRFVVLLVVVVACVAALIVCTPWSGRERTAPLSGERSHDFGRVELDGEIELSHTFELINVSDGPIVLRDVVASCGCIATESSVRTVEPGRRLQVTATLAARTPRRVVEQVNLVLADHGVFTLELAASAYRRHSITVLQQSVSLRSGLAEVTLVATDADSDTVPMTPKLSAPAEVSAEFIGWEPVFLRNAETGRPARWHGRIVVKVLGDQEISGGLWLDLGDDRVRVDLTGRSWRRADI